MSRVSKNIPQTDSGIKRRLIACLVCGFILFFLLIVRMGWLQFVQGSMLKERAYKQQIAIKTITPHRGKIYDSTGRLLARSTEVDTIFVTPDKLKGSGNTEVNKAMLAQALANLFDIDYTETLNQLESDVSRIKIAEKVDLEKSTALRKWLEENNIR